MTSAASLHVGLHVADLNRSVRFYRGLFGQEPAKHLDDYASFVLAEPPLVLALVPSPQLPGGALNHLGLRLPDANALADVQRRLEELGMPSQSQDKVACCYSRQTKTWAVDPDGNLWELYVFEGDLDHSGFEDAPLPVAAAPTAIWEHRLTEPIPEQIPLSDNTIDEVRLEGSFNSDCDEARLARLLRDVYRVLRPGGKVVIHALVGNRPFPGTPALPGLASLVRRVPVETEPADALLGAGFTGLFFEKLGDIHCFGVGGIELRELHLVGWRPQADAASRHVLYKGPLERVEDDDGVVYPRGQRVMVAGSTWERLRGGPANGQFVFF